jgi:hypothetical protein
MKAEFAIAASEKAAKMPADPVAPFVSPLWELSSPLNRTFSCWPTLLTEICPLRLSGRRVKVMKTQAWGWLGAAVLAAGLNASYHDGGLEWAHNAVDQIQHRSAAVLALASGRADQFLAEAKWVTSGFTSSERASAERTSAEHVSADHFLSDHFSSARSSSDLKAASCPWATAVARVEGGVARAQSEFARVNAMSDRMSARAEAVAAREEAKEEAQAVRVEANRERIEAHVEARMAQVHVPAVAFSPVAMKEIEVSACPRVRVRVPQMTRIEVPELPQMPKMPKIEMPAVPMMNMETPDDGSPI